MGILETPPEGKGFPAGFKSTPVPSPLLANLLEEIDDIAELKLTLRAIWFIHRRKGFPPYVREDELVSDRTTAAMLHASGEDLERVVRDAADKAVARGTFLRVRQHEGPDLYFLNTRPVRRALEASHDIQPAPEPVAEAWPAPADVGGRITVFAAYEANIGSLTPIVADRLKDALQAYPESWIHEAIAIAAEHNARHWHYISAILERWTNEGRPHGEPGTDPEQDRSEYIRRYLEAQRARGNG
ncbi:MAG: DnaD domain-containing protein [Chloroflexota bacterium]